MECKSLVPEWKNYQTQLLDCAKAHSTATYDSVLSHFSNESETVQSVETLRELHQRTARMAAEYDKNLEIATGKHDGDQECGACVLAMKKEILVDPSWSHLYLLGEAINAFDPFAMSQHVDHYYDLILSCSEKRDRSLHVPNLAEV